MKILVTGANGFVGKNLVSELNNLGDYTIFEFTKESKPHLLERYTKECDFVFHLAGINRPSIESEFMEGNFGFTSQLLKSLKDNKNNAPILFTSSIQANSDNPYGLSKKAGEDLLKKYSLETNTPVYIYRLPNLFGKWSKPNYNTVVATFCHNVANDLEVRVHDPKTKLTLCYIDDVIDEFKKVLDGNPTTKDGFCVVPVTYNISLGDLVELITSFKESRLNLNVPNMGDPLTKKLYSTYLSFLPEDRFIYDLNMHSDYRGSFTEIMRTTEGGQFSVNVSKLNITKGNHWHHTKNEKFLVVSGDALIRFRKINSEKIIEYRVSGEKLQVVDIPVGYAHSIVNIGDNDLVTVMWANECFDSSRTDTYFVEV